jgi:hypothetical protein
MVCPDIYCTVNTSIAWPTPCTSLPVNQSVTWPPQYPGAPINVGDIATVQLYTPNCPGYVNEYTGGTNTTSTCMPDGTWSVPATFIKGAPTRPATDVRILFTAQNCSLPPSTTYIGENTEFGFFFDNYAGITPPVYYNNYTQTSTVRFMFLWNSNYLSSIGFMLQRFSKKAAIHAP